MGQALREDTEAERKTLARFKMPQALCYIQCSVGKWTSIKVSINSSQLRAGKEKPRQECYFSLVLDGVGMQARRANYAS